MSPVDISHAHKHEAFSSTQVTPRPSRREEPSSYVARQPPPSPPPSEPDHHRDHRPSTPSSSQPSPEPEPERSPSTPEPLAPGQTLSSSSLTLELVQPLGTGTFSSVWLARDTMGQLGALELVRKSSLARSKSFRAGAGRGKGRSKGRGRREGAIDGTRPTRKKGRREREGPRREGTEVLSPGEGDGEEGAKVVLRKEGEKGGRLVAVKMTERSLCDANSRSRVSFVREVEVLRHIAHPSIVSYLHSFSTPTHHCLVLEHIAGGELLELVDAPARHARLAEPLVRRIWGELCRAVAWMHSVGLVHRDIKLENILLTTDPFTHPLPTSSLIKLTDFGLSRFIDPAQPLLTTLCGSESYAAPELVMGRAYDGRETDAWACGVVLYALATRRLPFDAPAPPSDGQGVGGGQAGGGIPHEQRARVEADWEVQRRKRGERRALLVRIAKGEYSWPEPDSREGGEGEGELRGAALARSEGIRRVVGRLLVRDPRKRARVAELWEDAWMRGEGAPPPPVLLPAEEGVPAATAEVAPLSAEDESEADGDADADAEGEGEGEVEDEGVLVDGEDIGPGSVARQEH
ncbi:kinase-like protein [Trametes cingulata]|nr:kinase-like protein [Trametes cingulata]